MTDDIELPVEANLPTPEHDPAKEAAMQAAFFHQQAIDERKRIMDALHQATKALEQKNFQIEQLNLALAERQNRHDSLQNSYNELIQDKADLEAILDNHQRDLENMAAKLSRFEFSRVRRVNKRKRGNGDAMPDPVGSKGEVAEQPPVLAHGSTVLDQPAEG